MDTDRTAFLGVQGLLRLSILVAVAAYFCGFVYLVLIAGYDAKMFFQPLFLAKLFVLSVAVAVIAWLRFWRQPQSKRKNRAP